MLTHSSTRSRENDDQVLPEKKLILIWSFAVFFVTMNSTMFNVAIPSVQADLSISVTTASWVISAYSIVLALSTLTFSRLSEFIPIKKLLTIGILLLSVGSIIGFMSKYFLLVLITRIVQATGAGGIVSLGQVVATRYIPITRRGKAMAAISSSAVLGLGLGPVIGGIVDQFFGWNTLFLVTCTILLFLPFFIKLLPKENIEIVSFDFLGLFLSSIFVISLMFFVTTFNEYILLLMVVIIPLLLTHFKRVQDPFIKVDLLKDKGFSLLLSMGFIVYFIYFAALFILPLLLTDIYQMKSSEIGLLVFPGAILSVITARIFGKYIDRFGNVPVIHAGLTLYLISSILFIMLSSNSPLFILLSYLFMSPGYSALATSIRNEISRILASENIGTGIGLSQLIQFFGGSFGVSFTGTIISLQSGMIPNLMYRNVYILLFVLIFLTIGLLGVYKRKLNVLKENQNTTL